MRFSAILTIAFLAVAGEARADGAHVTCVGDSITYGAGTASPSTDSYPAQLQGLLGAGYAVQNDGHSGATMLVTGDLPYTATAEYTASTSWAAAGGDVVIMLGTNDSKPPNWSKKASFEPDCESLVAHYQSAPGKPRVWVNLPPPAFAGACCTIDGTVIQNEILPLLKQCAAAKGAPTIDVFTALSGQGAHFSDGVHPDKAAALMIAQTVQAALAKQPTVSLSATAPSFTLPAAVTVKTTATAAYGKIEQVEIFEGTTSLAKSTAPNADIAISTLAVGPHALFAVATETGGRTATSSPPISVTVEAAAGAGPTPAPNPSPAPGPRPASGSGPAASPSSTSTPSSTSADGGCAVGQIRTSAFAFALVAVAVVALARRRHGKD